MKFKAVLRLGIPIFLLAFSTLILTFHVLPSVAAYTRTVDGDPSDWIGIPGGDNTWTVSNGEGIWRDIAQDDTGNGSYIYPNCTHSEPLIIDYAGAPWTGPPTEALAYTDKYVAGTEPFWYKHGGMVDLREFRVTGDHSYLYLTLRFENMGSQEIAVEWNKDVHVPGSAANATGFGKILAQVYIDQDRIPSSGRTNATMFGNFLIAPEAAWEVVIDIAGDPYSEYPDGDGYGFPRVEFANGTIYALNDTVASADPLQPQKAVYIQANCDIYPSCIELKVPYHVIGDPRGKTWRFVVVAGGYDEGKWRQVWSTETAKLYGWPPLFRFCGGEGEDPWSGDPTTMGNDPNIIDMAFTASQAQQEALLNEFQTTGQLVQINAYQDVEFDVGPVTPPEYRQVLLVEETVGISRVFEPVDYCMIFGDGQCLNASKEIRVTTIDDTEVPSQVYNITTYVSGYVKSCNVVFQANCTANSATMYNIYYGNPNATMPTYTTDLIAEATDTNITVANTHFRASFVKEDPGWYGIPDWINYLYYNSYNPTENLARADWRKILMTIINVPPYWFGPFTGPIQGTNVTIVEQGPVFIEVRAAFGDWKVAGVNSLVKTYRFYSRIPWFLFSIHLNLTGANYEHLQTESYLSETALPWATYRTTSGSIKTIDIRPDIGDILDWDGSWIDAENTNATDNIVGMGFIAMNGTDPPYTGFRSDRNSIAPFQSGSLLEARQNLAILLHQGNYTVTEQAYKMISQPLTIYVGPDTVPPSINPPSHYPETPDEWENVTVSVKVTDGESGVKNVTLSYTINNGTSWTNLTMDYNSKTGLYEVTIPGQQYCTWVKYKIIAFDKVGNQAINDKAGQLYVYHVIPEFPTWASILLILCVFAGVSVILRRKMQNQKLHTNGT